MVNGREIVLEELEKEMAKKLKVVKGRQKRIIIIIIIIINCKNVIKEWEGEKFE